MNLLRCYRINRPNVVYETFDDEIVIINLDSGNYYSLDKAGADIWDFIERGAAISEIVEGIINRYKSSKLDNIKNAVNQSITELEKEGLIVPNKTEKSENRKSSSIQVKAQLKTEKLIFKKPVLEKFTDMQDFLLVDPIHEIDYTDWPKKKK